MDAGPHPGCAEFAPPIWAQCPMSAREIVVVKFESQGPFDPKGRAVWKLCREHAQEMTDLVAQGIEPGARVAKRMEMAT